MLASLVMIIMLLFIATGMVRAQDGVQAIQTQDAAQKTQALHLIGTANLSLNLFQDTGVVNNQYEISLFFDADYLDKAGAGLGFIRQNQGTGSDENIVNNLIHLNGWYRWFPEGLPGKLSLVLNYYHGEEQSLTGSSRSGMSRGRSDVSVVSGIDSLAIINPVVAYVNYARTFSMDIGYARSNYETSSETLGDLQVTQWSPGFGFALNDRYDWLQVRIHDIRLSNDDRTPGVNATRAGSVSWTHWLKAHTGNRQWPESFTLAILGGKRLYAVDHEIRKIYNLSDLQTGSYVFGMTWKTGISSEFYLYGGYEQYEDVALENRYNSLFAYTGISKRW